MIEEKKDTSIENKEDEKKLESINIVCSKHGLINNGALYLRYSTLQNGEQKTAVDNNNIFCIACLNDLYMKFQQSGDIGKISVNVKYDDGTKSEDIPVDQANIEPKKEEN